VLLMDPVMRRGDKSQDGEENQEGDQESEG
jgi:hypothetical protein